MITLSSKSKNPYKPLNGRPARRPELATSARFGPSFVDNLDGSTIINSGLATRRYYRLARTNPEIRTAIRALTQAVFWVKGGVQPRNDYERHPEFRDLDGTIMDLLTTQIEGLGNFHRLSQDLFTYAIRCGYAVAEKIWEPVAGSWTLCALKPKRPWDFEPMVDEFGDLHSLFYYPTGEYFDPRAFVFAPWPSSGAANWLGEPIMEALFHDVELMQKSEAALAKNAHLLSKRTLVHRFDANRSDEEIAAAKQAVIDLDVGMMPQFPSFMGENGRLMQHDELEIMQDRTSVVSMSKLGELAEMSARRIKRTYGLPDDLGSTNVVSGSWAKARVSFDMLMASASDGQDWLAAMVDEQIIADIVQFNYPNLPSNYRLPAWIPQEIEEKYSVERAQYWQILVDMGVVAADAQIIAEDLGIPFNQTKVSKEAGTLAESGIATTGEKILRKDVPKLRNRVNH